MRLDSLYQQYEKLLHKIAWSFHRSTGIDRDELFSEACLAFVEKIESYDPSRGAQSTYITTVVSNALRDYMQSEYKHDHDEFIDLDSSFSDVEQSDALEASYALDARMEQTLMLKQNMARLSTVAYKVSWLVTNHPAVLGITDTESDTKARGKVIKHLRDTEKLPWAQVRSTMRELRAAVQVENHA